MAGRMIVYESNPSIELPADIIDGAEDLMGDDIGMSDYDPLTEAWPGVPRITIPKAYRGAMTPEDLRTDDFGSGRSQTE
jgi:hypothetical protein